MAGASRNHGEAGGNLYFALHGHLRSKPCRPFIARDPDDYYLRFPKLIIEVLSPSTERLDRMGKFILYRSLRITHGQST